MTGKLICTCEKLQGVHQPGCVLHPEMMQSLIGTLAERIKELEARPQFNGELVLHNETIINGRRYAAGKYRIQRVGDVPELTF